jgi:hypothetical protein
MGRAATELMGKQKCLPENLIAVSKQNFMSVGGVLFECVSFSKVNGFDDVAVRYIFPRCSLLNFEFQPPGVSLPSRRFQFAANPWLLSTIHF